MPVRQAKALAEHLLQRFAMESVAEQRNPSLTTEERFCVKLLRATTVEDAILVLDRPFSILTDHRTGRFLTDALRKVDDLIAETHIFDYSWDKDRYEVPNDTEA